MPEDPGDRRRANARNAGNKRSIAFQARMAINMVVDLLLQLRYLRVEPSDMDFDVVRHVLQASNCMSFQPVLFLLADVLECLKCAVQCRTKELRRDEIATLGWFFFLTQVG